MVDSLHHAVAVRSEPKYFPTSHAEICGRLRNKGRVDVRVEHPVSIGTAVDYVDLRLNIACTTTVVKAWSAALKIDRFRVDGIDHHEMYDTPDGKKARGWHRHGWDNARGTEQNDRTPVENFDDVADVETFVRRVCETLGIVLDQHDRGLFDEM